MNNWLDLSQRQIQVLKSYFLHLASRDTDEVGQKILLDFKVSINMDTDEKELVIYRRTKDSLFNFTISENGDTLLSLIRKKKSNKFIKFYDFENFDPEMVIATLLMQRSDSDS